MAPQPRIPGHTPVQPGFVSVVETPISDDGTLPPVGMDEASGLLGSDGVI